MVTMILASMEVILTVRGVFLVELRSSLSMESMTQYIVECDEEHGPSDNDVDDFMPMNWRVTPVKEISHRW